MRRGGILGAILAMAGGSIDRGHKGTPILGGGIRKRGGYTWTRPHSSKRSRMRRLCQAVEGRLTQAEFYNGAEYLKAHANYHAAVAAKRKAATAARKRGNPYV